MPQWCFLEPAAAWAPRPEHALKPLSIRRTEGAEETPAATTPAGTEHSPASRGVMRVQPGTCAAAPLRVRPSPGLSEFGSPPPTTKSSGQARSGAAKQPGAEPAWGKTAAVGRWLPRAAFRGGGAGSRHRAAPNKLLMPDASAWPRSPAGADRCWRLCASAPRGLPSPGSPRPHLLGQPWFPDSPARNWRTPPPRAVLGTPDTASLWS